MHIRRLELFGFKSFVSRTHFDFPDGITGVVGPNGCGKSNIVDAIRWVLGEQSPTHLRGRAMEDIIFNGNERTGPLGMAEVSLVLERAGGAAIWDEARNGEGGGGDGNDPEIDQATDLQRQLAGVSEITVTRRYFRSGESEFFINRVPCRLRDITELFLGSGVGTKAYAIIEQGRVEQLVNAKPETLRLFIEEAAGTTRYRGRKVMAERKLERTRDNLMRLTDVIGEIERQIGTLTRQAQRAEEFRRCRQDLRDLEVRAARVRYAELRVAIAAAEARLGPLADEERRLARGVEDAEAATLAARARVQATEHRQRDLQLGVVQHRLEADAGLQRVGYLEETLGNLGERRRDVEEEQRRLSTEIERTAGERQTAEHEFAGLEAAVRDAGSRHGSLVDELRRREQLLCDAEAGLDTVKGTALEVVSEDVRIRNTVVSLTHRQDEIRGRLARGRQQVEEIRATRRGATEALTAVEARLRAQVLEFEGAEAIARERAHQVDVAKGAESAAAAVAEAARERAAALRSRLASLEELHARGDDGSGVTGSGVRADGTAFLGVVADVLRVPVDYEPAVAVALGSRLHCMVARDQTDAVRALDALSANGGGRASFVPLQPRRFGPARERRGGSLLDVVDFPGEFGALAEYLLGHVVVVDSLSEALARWHENGSAATFVTRSGEMVDAAGLVMGGRGRSRDEIRLIHAREVRDLRTETVAAAALGSEAVEGHQQAVARLEEARALHVEALTHTQALHVEHTRALKDEERIRQEEQRLRLEVGALEAATGELAREDAEIGEAVAVAHRQLDELRLVKDQGDAELLRARAALAEARASADMARAALTELAVEEARQRAGRDSAEETRRRAAVLIEAAGVRSSELQARAVQLGKDEERLTEERAAILMAREEHVAALAQRESELTAAQIDVTAAEAATARCEVALREERRALDRVREERPAIDVSLAELRAALEHLLATIGERHEEDLASLHEIAEAATPLSAADGDRIEALRRRLTQIGDVHAGAVEELEELRQRHEFLVRERDDLQRSVDDLRRTIAKLNRLSQARFQETFEEANAKLQQIVPRLFPGGRAHLVLTEAEEGEERGVEIVVQPAGKKLQSLTLLSGGEKALTAVSLILSLFMIRPTPFCILDEVDAPLDDVNVGRFDDLVREISRTSQFVVITHNKRTMEAADTLYGITMEDPGTSRVVSVRFKEAA